MDYNLVTISYCKAVQLRKITQQSSKKLNMITVLNQKASCVFWWYSSIRSYGFRSKIKFLLLNFIEDRFKIFFMNLLGLA